MPDFSLTAAGRADTSGFVHHSKGTTVANIGKLLWPFS
jgi:hypothetical protein